MILVLCNIKRIKKNIIKGSDHTYKICVCTSKFREVKLTSKANEYISFNYEKCVY